MSAPMDSDEDDSFVVVGTPLEVFEDDEARKKPVSLHDLPVKDSRGRTRFHGAFTGGFSAGFFNTVGSREGFQPSSFVSSRAKKEDTIQQRPEDFMDDEDFSEHGIAPKKLATSSTYTSEERGKKRKEMATAIAGGSGLPGVTETLAQLIVPESLPVGVRLLRKMGWKEGQGIGPRERRRKKKTRQRAAGARVIGCALPPSVDSSDDEPVDEKLQNITFAPKDCNPVTLKAKDNVHGLGYSGLDPTSALPSSHINLFEAPPVKGKGRRGIRGQAFGVGALEDDDDDIYALDHLSNYDMTMEIEDKGDNFGWTAPKHHNKGKQQVPVGYVGKLLEGFTLTTKPLKPKKVFKAPVIPQGFRPVHRFVKPCYEENLEKHNAVSRGVVLGETPIFKSVFDLVSQKDKDRLAKDVEEKKEERHKPSPGLAEDGRIPRTGLEAQTFIESSRTRMESVPVTPSGFKDADNRSIMAPSSGDQTVSSNSLFQGRLSFKPFDKEPGKQGRYDRYLTLCKQGVKDSYEAVAESHMTEWEKEREKEEFVKAAKLYKPLNAMMATRFTSAKFADDVDKTDVPAETEKSEQAKAAEMKMFGRLTRDELEWHPDKLLCRRFNVPHPYPGSTVTGLLTTKRDKYSVFNFLEFPTNARASSEPEEQVMSIEYKETSQADTAAASVKPPKETMKSFSLKNNSKPSVKPALGSIFSVLYEDDEKHKQAKQTHMEQEKIEDMETDKKLAEAGPEKVENVASKEDGAPSLDLFRAIFKNSDSEDTSSESEQEDVRAESAAAAMPDTAASSTKEDINSKSTAEGASDLTPTPAASVAVETLNDRLSPPVSDTTANESAAAYGPALPPPGSSQVPSASKTIDLTQSGGQTADLIWVKSHHKHKHKNKDRRKHKHKDKKAKDKKSKHKKKERKKKKKKNEKKESSSDDVDASSSDTDSEGDITLVSDREILGRLKTGGGARLKAADFM